MSQTDRKTDRAMRVHNKNVDKPYELAAKETTAKGWVCLHCSRFYIQENQARQCCATSRPCKCGGRAYGMFCPCKDCSEKMRSESWYAKTAVEWDGQFPIGVWSDDQFFWDADEFFEYLMERQEEINSEHFVLGSDEQLMETIDEVWLTRCKPSAPRHIDLMNYLYDDLPEDCDELPAGGAEVEEAVNKWIDSIQPLSWHMTGQRLCPDSVRRQLGGAS